MISVLKKAISEAYNFSEYRMKISTLFKEGKVTGCEQSEKNLNFTGLNEQRMNRLEKTIMITPEMAERLKNLHSEYILLVISEGWCGDSAQIVPVIYKMADVSDKIDLKIVFRDENDDLMNLFLTNGTRSIPKLIILDKNSLEVLGQFGPRPEPAKQLILDYKASHGVVDETAKTALHLWYAKDKGTSIKNEIMEIMMMVD